uniref:Uncharacterized protein n=1 Tax=Callorhinchus milii TaxID=7868 RepID=A0A4W3I811_CALMI
ETNTLTNRERERERHTETITTAGPRSGVKAISRVNYSIWSTFSLHFMNMCCFGFVALIFSIKSRDKKILGDIEAAKRHAQTTKKLNITAISSICHYPGCIYTYAELATPDNLSLSPFLSEQPVIGSLK